MTIIQDLYFDIQLRIVSTVRAPDGVPNRFEAISDPGERRKHVAAFQALQVGVRAYYGASPEKGFSTAEELISIIESFSESGVTQGMIYDIRLLDPLTLIPISGRIHNHAGSHTCRQALLLVSVKDSSASLSVEPGEQQPSGTSVSDNVSLLRIEPQHAALGPAWIAENLPTLVLGDPRVWTMA